MIRLFNPRRPAWRLLRYYQRMAQQYHQCQDCHFLIGPGDRYGAHVSVLDGKLRVSKFHLDGCPTDPEEDERMRKDNERSTEELLGLEESRAVA